MIGLVAVCIVVSVTRLAPKVGVSAPLILVVVGVAVSLLPAVPAVEVEPEWILAGVLPPLLYAAAVGMPAMDFRRDLTAISGLSIVLVIVTAVLMGALLTLVVPGISLATGVAVGAVISPTDAVATSIVRKLGVSPRIVTVLEGESLLNDASALVLLRSAIAATATGFAAGQFAFQFLYAIVVAVLLGALVGWVGLRVRARLNDSALTTAVSFVVPFAAFLPSERLGASGLVATVAAGIVTGVGSPRRLRPQDRLAESANWRTIEVLLEGAVFLLMGLELFGLLRDVEEAHSSALVGVGVGLLCIAGVLLVRAAFVAPLLLWLGATARRGEGMKSYLSDLGDRADPATEGDLSAEDLSRLRISQRQQSDQQAPQTRERLRTRVTRAIADIDYLTDQPLKARDGVLLVWAGMRGAITVAAATTLPTDTPNRSLLVLIAFVVAAGSLLVQGGTLPWLVRRLGLARQTTSGADMRDLVMQINQAAAAVVLDPELRRADGTPYDDMVLTRTQESVRRHAPLKASGSAQEARGTDEETVQEEYEEELAEAASKEYDPDDLSSQVRELRVTMIEAQRAELLRLRSMGTVSSQVLTRLLRVLDADQLSLELRSPDGGW